MIYNEIFYENNQPSNKLLFVRQAGELINDVNYSISRKDSPTHTIGILKSGRLNLDFEDRHISLMSGQCVYFPHNIAYSITADKKNPAHFLWVNIRGKLMDAMSDAIFENKYALSEADLTGRMSELKELLMRRWDCFKEISAIIYEMLLDMYSSQISADLSKEKYSEYEIYISNSVQTGFSVEDMAKHFHCSTDTINRQFQKKHGITPYRYYQNLRMEIAESMLCRTELTIEDISERLHFFDRNHFSQCFKKATGHAPAWYKKNNMW